MEVISTHKFKYTLKDIHKYTDSRKFCFVIGAGASKSSGIPTGGELANRWFAEIKDRTDQKELTAWINKEKIIVDDLASFYGNIYRKRFEIDKTSGYEFLVQAMKTASPSFGHIVLGQILSRTSGQCVLTTNFDSLVESAVYQFTDKTPLVCGHESLSGYARPSATHPLIIKIHRDLLLDPKNDPDEINELAHQWKSPLDHIFSTHIPIVIGYGGNDGSLMSYFEKMNKPSNFFWCGLNSEETSPRIKKLIEKHKGSFVTIANFDTFMYELLWVFDEIKPIKEELNDIASARIQIANKQLEEISTLENTIQKLKDPDGVSVDKKELSALEYSNLADKETDLEKRKQIYLEALNKYPDTGWLWWRFTYFLHFTKKDFFDLEMYYQKSIELNNKNAGPLANYALFLKDVKKDYLKAEEYYLKALSTEPNHAVSNGNYAQILLEKDKKDEAKRFIDVAALNCTTEVDLLIELWFYRYAHFPEFLSEAENKIEELLAKGIRSSDWNFDGNIDLAIKDHHPNPEKLKEFAQRITTGIV